MGSGLALKNEEEDEEEKKPVAKTSFSKGKNFSQKLKKPGNMIEIDTDSINELYLYGGEKGKKMMKQEELDQEDREIAELAHICVKYMRGEIAMQDDFYNSKMPDIPQQRFNAPLSVKGIKNINLGSQGV